MRTLLQRGWGAVVRGYAQQPLAFASMSLVLGLCGGFFIHLGAVHVAVATLGALFLCACGIVLSMRSRFFSASTAVAMLMVCGFFFYVGYLRAWCDAWGRSDEAHRVAVLSGTQACVVRVGLDVIQKPLRGASARYTFYADECTIQTAAAPISIRYLPVRVEWYAGLDDKPFAPAPGEIWRFSGKVTVRPLRNGLSEIRLSSGKGEKRSVKLAVASSESWYVRFDHLRRQAIHRVTIGIESWGAIPALNQAMLLGARHEMPADMKRVFSNSGTIHVFAISGMNIALVAAFLIAVIRLLGIPRFYWGFFLAPLLVVYTVISGACPSAVRACIMAIILFFAPLFGRRPNGVAALALTALIVHLIKPALIVDAGSLFSFTVMLGLVLFVQPFSVLLRRVFQCAWFEQRSILYQSAGNRFHFWLWRSFYWCVRYISDVLAVSLAAWLVSVPLTAYYFGRLTPGGLFANLVITPASFMVVVAGCVGLASSYFSLTVATFFNQIAGLFTQVMVWSAERTAACPGMNLEIARWSPVLVALYFTAVVLFAFLVRSRSRKSRGLEWLEH